MHVDECLPCYCTIVLPLFLMLTDGQLCKSILLLSYAGFYGKIKAHSSFLRMMEDPKAWMKTMTDWGIREQYAELEKQVCCPVPHVLLVVRFNLSLMKTQTILISVAIGLL